MSGSASDAPVAPPPTEPLHPVRAPAPGRGRYLFTELIIVTAGVLIALSVDSFREWSQHRALVSEAHRNIVEEIRRNANNLEGALKQGEALNQQVDTALQLVSDLLKKKTSTIKSLEFNSVALSVTDTNWRSAERTGALGQMSYGEVQKYSEVYQAQALYADYQRKLLDLVTAALSAVEGDPFDASPRELEVLRERILAIRGQLYVETQVGQQLLVTYRKALAR